MLSRPTLTERLVDQLTEDIDSGQLLPGQRLPTEAALIDRFQVSRTVVREAVARLRASGLVESQQGRGTFVLTRPSQSRFEFATPAPQSLPELVQVIEFRVGIETEAAALAAMRRVDADLDTLRRALDDVQRSIAVPARSIEADYQFHLAVARASRNRHYANLMGALGPLVIVVPRARRTASADGSGEAVSNGHAELLRGEHGTILGAIERGDPQAAAAAMRVHLVNSAERVRREH
jgi:GntR family transcriptional regulator, transcriptional repressor for pyruvate dehydrogenase complex